MGRRFLGRLPSGARPRRRAALWATVYATSVGDATGDDERRAAD